MPPSFIRHTDPVGSPLGLFPSAISIEYAIGSSASVVWLVLDLVFVKANLPPSLDFQTILRIPYHLGVTKIEGGFVIG